MLYQNILSNYKATIGELAQTIGVIVSSFRAVPYGQMYYESVEVWGGTDQVAEIGVRWYCRQNKFPWIELQTEFLCLKAFCKN